jgi:transcriptional regulator CtsR
VDDMDLTPIKPQVTLPKGFSLVSGGGGWTVQHRATMVHTNDSTMVQPIIEMLQRELTRQATEDLYKL